MSQIISARMQLADVDNIPGIPPGSKGVPDQITMRIYVDLGIYVLFNVYDSGSWQYLQGNVAIH